MWWNSEWPAVGASSTLTLLSDRQWISKDQKAALPEEAGAALFAEFAITQPGRALMADGVTIDGLPAQRVTIDGPVGLRFQKQNVLNNSTDQQTIANLLANISNAQGGRKEDWRAPPLPGPNRECAPWLSSAIWEFQMFWKSKGHIQIVDGVVDPDGSSLAHLNMLAKGVTPLRPPPGPATPFVTPLKQNAAITLDGRKAVQRSKPIYPAEWVRRTQAAFDTLCLHPLGRQIVLGRHKKVVVAPYLLDDLNAGSGTLGDQQFLQFTAENFDAAQSSPGTRSDEIVLHELIHLAENDFGGYVNVPESPLRYERLDFLTIIGTNVYSSSLNRGLRGEHPTYIPMPAPFASDAAAHATVFRINYQRALNHNKALFNLFRNQSAPWNPFKYFTP